MTSGSMGKRVEWRTTDGRGRHSVDSPYEDVETEFARVGREHGQGPLRKHSWITGDLGGTLLAHTTRPPTFATPSLVRRGGRVPYDWQ